jgi:hypothetical protein
MSSPTLRDSPAGEPFVLTLPLLALLVVAGASALAALAARADLGTAGLFLLAAVAAAALALVVGLRDRVRWSRPPPVEVYLDPGVVLRESLVSAGAFGRETIVAHLGALDRARGDRLLGITPELEAMVRRMSRSEFLDWAEREIAILERAT